MALESGFVPEDLAWLLNVYMETDEGGKDSPASCMQITWFCVVSSRKT